MYNLVEGIFMIHDEGESMWIEYGLSDFSFFNYPQIRLIISENKEGRDIGEVKESLIRQLQHKHPYIQFKELKE